MPEYQDACGITNPRQGILDWIRQPCKQCRGYVTRPTYGTRRMVAQMCRETHTATNRKKIQRIFRKLGWIEPQKTKNDIIRTNRKLFKPDAPNQLWETDMTYVWCGIGG